MTDFDTDEESGEVDLSPFQISWLDLSFTGADEKLGISGLPGCRFKDTWRNLNNDLKCLQNSGVKEVFTLCTKGELNKYRVPNLLHDFSGSNITVHHYPFPDGQVPPSSSLLKMVEELRVNIMNQKKSLIHCFGGLGRSCLVAVCLMMVMDESISPEDAIDKARQLRGAAAIQSVKQYNFINDFRKLQAEVETEDGGESRSVSR
ncbi:cyclin-dependent kinase inhibitor 3-like [Haliotis rufescens]|uniref:cyclin-dependent kinase inhibitor 3-like n=1 Tax=Haliotis rufescens TaxID=6454 RepID=UPI001EB09DA3|nr:cyclin-dependent kinase inhibitor 3-like [Haliotis rufescens]XP_048258861.1 cyclin-dependent kinase inhibitor 3-like [Haliotis rufescens]